MLDFVSGIVAYLGIFLVGLGLNLTPCVYPMLSVTISLFGGSKKIRKRQAFLKALVYVLGMAVMYSTLGVIAALTGGFFGGILQNPIVLIAVSLFLLLLSLSLFGVYTFRLPSQWVNAASGQTKTGWLGIFLSGLMVGIFAAPCTGPAVIALFTFVGTRGDPFFAFSVFFVMALGLGFPYLILGTFSGLLRRLPKSGMWMVWVEHFFGVILLILAAYYLIIALMPAYLHFLLPLALFFSGLYLGFFERSGQHIKAFAWFKRLFGAIALLAAVTILFWPPKVTIQWNRFSYERLAAAKEMGKPVIIDFYADWCIACRELDLMTYSNPGVISALEPFERLKCDLTQVDTPEAEKTVKEFNIIGVPVVLLFDAEGNEAKDLRVDGFVSPGDLLNLIQQPRFKSKVNLSPPSSS